MRVLVTGAAGSIGQVVSVGLTDRGHDAVRAVFDEERLDGVVHLAGHPDEAGLADALGSHTVTTAALLDACVPHSVNRFVYASSNHAVGLHPRPQPSKSDPLTVDAISCRIGSFRVEPTSVRELSTWLSHDDCVRMVEAALTVPAPGYAVLYGISANTRAWWDLEPGRALGYEPLDDAEHFADRIAPAAGDEAENAYVGGPFASEAFYRPALDSS